MAGMKVTCETDTGIYAKFFRTPDWSLEDDPVYVIHVDREKLPSLLTQLEEWVRQIKEEVNRVRDA
jgi:hypothetical protein